MKLNPKHPRSDLDRFPDFESPPVVEVALSVSFDPLPRVTAADLGALWQLHFRGRGFPWTADHPRVTMATERFDAIPTAPSFRIEVVKGAPTPRLWFLNEAGTHLVQVQDDWFARNWRKMDTEEAYPRYEQVRKSFDEDFALFRGFLESEDLGAIVPHQCEVTYVNHIAAGEGWDGLPHIDQVLRTVGRSSKLEFLPAAEFARVSTQYIIPDEKGQPVGRLYINAEPAFKPPHNTPMMLLTLTARGRTGGEGLSSVSTFLDIGHRWVVHGFVDVTTDRMHQVWGLKNGD